MADGNNNSIHVYWYEVTMKKALEKTLQALREGLNIRNNTIRPEKQFSSTQLYFTMNPRKKPTLVEGIVVDDSPAIGTNRAIVGLIGVDTGPKVVQMNKS